MTHLALAAVLVAAAAGVASFRAPAASVEAPVPPPGAPPGGAPAEAPRERATVRYALLPESRFDVHTGTAGLLGGAAHHHLVRARTFDGAIEFDQDDPARSRFEITVKVDGLEVLTPADEGDRRKIRHSMLTRVLHAERYPDIHFVSTEVKPIDGGLRITGDLTLAGATRPISVDAAVREEGEKLLVSGDFSVLQTDFGIHPYSAGLGTIKVADRIRFDFEAVGAR